MTPTFIFASLTSDSLQVADMESSSPFSAVCKVFGLNYILNIFGVSKVVAETAGSEVKKDVSGNSGVTAEVMVEQN